MGDRIHLQAVDRPEQGNAVHGVGDHRKTAAQTKDLGGSVAASHYKEGDPQREVIRLGEELDAGLIIMGGHRRSWLERIFGAGFSEKVCRRANRPVLVVGGRGLRGSSVPR